VKAHLDDRDMLRLLCFEFPQLKVDRLDLTLQNRRLQLEVEIEHRLRLARERLRLSGLRRLVFSELLEVAVRRGPSVTRGNRRRERTNV
jgi:hypothetical protein